jgi:hypothetical protein
LAQKQEPKRAQANKQRQQDYGSDVRQRGDATRKTTNNSANNDHRQKQDEREQTKENERSDIVQKQSGDHAKSFHWSHAADVNDGDHEITDEPEEERETNPDDETKYEQNRQQHRASTI